MGISFRIRVLVRRSANAVRLLLTLPLRAKSLLLHAWYGPSGILLESSSNAVFGRSSIGRRVYSSVSVSSGRIYTDCKTNIAVLSDKSLVPVVSWEYRHGSVLGDPQNSALVVKGFVNCLPSRVSGVLVSLLSGGGGNYNYYHWLFDVLPRLRLADACLDGRANPIHYLVPCLDYSFQVQTLRALGILEESCVSSLSNRHMRADLLIATEHPNPEPHDDQGWIIDWLRSSFLPASCSYSGGGELIFISRSDSVNLRRLDNEEWLSGVLSQAGFFVCRLSEMSFGEQVSLFSSAAMIVGIHGAGFANLAFASPGAVVFELFSQAYQPDMYEKISLYNSLEYHSLVCESGDSDRPGHLAGVRLSMEQLDIILTRASSLSPAS